MTSKRSLRVSESGALARGTRFGLAGLLLAGTVVSTGCLDRPVGTASPVTTNVNVTKQSNNAITAIDLLLMIDNSASMADKQATLAAAVPQLLGQLVQPKCVDADGNPTGGVATLGANIPCASGSPEFNPVNNIHIGIVTSSLGDHGANSICKPSAPTQYLDPSTNQPILQPDDVNDMGRLVGTLTRAGDARTDTQTASATLDTLGFLAWGNANSPSVGEADLTAANQIFKDLVSATHEVGCGFEASLEGWFRFLIDPVPPVLPLDSPDPTSHYTARKGSDDTLLNQRAAFLRPDSLVAIVMLTDENDCSVRDTDVGWVSATTSSLITRGSDQCAANPNDRCCYSCTANKPKDCAEGCNPAGTAVDDGIYQANIRCWNQKRRFGYEFLYPKSRYVVGLTKPLLCPDQSFGDMDCDCTFAKSIGAGCDKGPRTMPNPLYSVTVGTLSSGVELKSTNANAVPRSDNGVVFLAGIVGVPWQDIGRLNNGTLEYIPVTDLAWSTAGAGTQPDNTLAGSSSIWDMIYGDDNANIQPKDIHMVESIVPRTDLPGPTAAKTADPYNGHEYNTARSDLEYACTYKLPTARPCACTAGDSYASCKYLHPNDCCDQSFQADGAGGPGGDFNKPLCTGTTQDYAKGYPGLREIAVLKDYATSAAASTKGNSIVASICPQDLTSDSKSPGYGYNPAVAALINRLKEKLKGSCLPRPLQPLADGTLPCQVIEAVSPAIVTAGGGSDCKSFCEKNGRTLAEGPIVKAVDDQMVTSLVCDNGVLACKDMCLCKLPQVSTADLLTCQTVTDGSDVSLPPGYCYIDADAKDADGNPAPVGNAELVKKCPTGQKRILRFVGNNPTATPSVRVPLGGSVVFTACQGASLNN